ncbi:HEAT repeat domain-containing protein [Borreliella burgdorferi]|uniref:HEAT repeat domain-containing protein n=1 Tax=Borreliella burgdorferi TaxID=139 RepID=UPI001E5DE5CD|nr:HEAT repeat domain-containing protein [Borreliella burgdorferi]MCD2383020.1 HEAT repeat domain-containing protein [Borreliella burgdorferi]MCD2389712.1 HEAT repeat domain-containing protein [Borreliella burgdorferi]MCD2394606.1 HEAT repeat domain-containing protein [Borreliella burgdorferi]MCD2395229.1 HEAT repeat domain-containing protein [Borreliella burgdorferi]MCD2396927.1 HEAT repeat domain-containing protein [Borreliella burgdorferi]
MKYFYFLFFLLIFNVYAQNVNSPTLPSPPLLPKITENKPVERENSSKGENSSNVGLDGKYVNDTILYGLDSQVTSIIKALKKSSDSQYNFSLKKRLEKTFNAELKREILELFISLKYSGGIDTANYILENYESKRYSNALFGLAISYLKEFDDKEKLKKTLIDILENKEGNVVSIAAYYLGELNSLEYSKNMMEVFEKYSGNDGARREILIALGKMSAVDYQDRIYEISLDNYEGPSIKAAAIEALSYLASDKVTENADLYLQSNNNNLNVKLAIIASLSKDPSLKSKEILQGFLRDSDDNIRFKAINAIKGHRDPSAKDILIYKLKSDPSLKVREASAKALIDMDLGNIEIKNIMFDFKIDNNFKISMFSYLLDKDSLKALSIALEIVNKENINRPSNVLRGVASMLAGKKGNFDNFYSKIIDSKNIDLRHLALKGAVYNKSSSLSDKLKKIKSETNSEYIKMLLKDY